MTTHNPDIPVWVEPETSRIRACEFEVLSNTELVRACREEFGAAAQTGQLTPAHDESLNDALVDLERSLFGVDPIRVQLGLEDDSATHKPGLFQIVTGMVELPAPIKKPSLRPERSELHNIEFALYILADVVARIDETAEAEVVFSEVLDKVSRYYPRESWVASSILLPVRKWFKNYCANIRLETP